MNDLDSKLMLILEDLIEYERDPQPMKVGDLTFIEQIKHLFYERFEKKLNDLELQLTIHNKSATKEQILELAKEASGIDS